jgi:hypothetical protein
MIIIDRFEEDKAILEIGDEFITIPRSVLPKEAKEGDVLNIVIDADETTARRDKIETMMKKLFKE